MIRPHIHRSIIYLGYDAVNDSKTSLLCMRPQKYRMHDHKNITILYTK
jgi:hypothetical protein